MGEVPIRGTAFGAYGSFGTMGGTYFHLPYICLPLDTNQGAVPKTFSVEVPAPNRLVSDERVGIGLTQTVTHKVNDVGHNVGHDAVSDVVVPCHYVTACV